MIYAEQPYRVVPPRRRLTGWPYKGDEWAGRPWPCGHLAGVYLCGPGDECRAADVVLEDYAGPPDYARYGVHGPHGGAMRVESTHVHTEMTSLRDDGQYTEWCKMFTFDHPQGIR